MVKRNYYDGEKRTVEMIWGTEKKGWDWCCYFRKENWEGKWSWFLLSRHAWRVRHSHRRTRPLRPCRMCRASAFLWSEGHVSRQRIGPTGGVGRLGNVWLGWSWRCLGGRVCWTRCVLRVAGRGCRMRVRLGFRLVFSRLLPFLFGSVVERNGSR